MLDTFDDDYTPPARPLWTRLYGRFMHWLWFGPLTRDLHASRRGPLPVPPEWRAER